MKLTLQNSFKPYVQQKNTKKPNAATSQSNVEAKQKAKPFF
jgi:hypothetical protein